MNRNSATLRLTEPVIFLRNGSDSASRRRRAGRTEYPPALLRGLLTLKLVKPTRVKSIEVVLEGVAKTEWPDMGGGISARRMEIMEENTFLTFKEVLFHAESPKRSRTVGPGVVLGDRRSGIESGSGDSLDNARGRTTRRQSNDMHGSYTQAYNRGEQLRAITETTRPQLNLDTTGGIRAPESNPQDHRLHTSSAIDETDTPPLYSSLNAASSSRPNTAEPSASRRRSNRLSLTGMLHDVRSMVQGHPARHDIENERLASPILESQQTPEDGSDMRGRSRGRKDKGPIARLGEALGIDGNSDDDEDDDGDSNAKEMKPGSYNYPISFTLPVNLPPSVEADYATVRYKLKAVVHRPGTFTSKITASCPVELVSAPTEDDTEEGDAVVIERQWDMELRYLISISGRNFCQGSDIPWHVQLMPLNKMKLHRLTFVLEEKIEYNVHSYKLTRKESDRRFQLLCIRHPQSLSNVKQVARSSPALLPVWSPEGSATSEGVLLEYADPPLTMMGENSESQRKTEALAHILSPDGPWHLHGVLKVPLTHLHTSHKNPASFVSIKHSLKIFLRVEKGSDDALDPKTGRKKQFDIIIETTVNILSKYCRPDWASLPRYESLDPPPMVDFEQLDEGARVAPMTAHSSRSDVNGDASSAPLSPIVAPAHVSRPVTPTGDSPRASAPSTPIELADPQRDFRVQASQRFASLVAGFEDEGGELPPTYQSVAGIPGPSRVIQLTCSPSRANRTQSGSREHSRSNIGSRNSSRAPEHRSAWNYNVFVS